MSSGPENLEERLRDFSTVGKRVRFCDKSDRTKYYTYGKVIDEVSVFDKNYKFFVQKLEAGEETKYRFCYYTLDAEETRIVFGEGAPAMDEEVFAEFMRKAREEFGPFE